MTKEERKIPLCEPDVGELEIKYVTETIKNNMVSSGAPPVRKFEESFAKRFNAKHAIAVNSGGSALFLSVKALGVGPGDEVIVPTFTMIATPEAVSHCGARPVFVDSKSDNPNIDPEKIEEEITPRTKAILIAHLFGIPCDMDKVMPIAQKHNLPVIEDAAEAHGSTYNGRLAGRFGVIGCFSFYASKIMTSGEGGMVITDNDGLAEKIRRLREYDINPKKPYIHEILAWNLRMSALEAALGLAQLERLDELMKKRNAVAKRYIDNLKHIPQIKFFSEPPNTTVSTWLFTILAERRDELVAHLAENGVEAKRVFVPMHLLPPYKQGGDFSAKGGSASGGKNAEDFGRRGVSLPSASTLNERDQDFVIAKIKEFCQK